MYKRKINLKNILIPSDSIAIVVIILGLLIALFLSEIAIRLIGVSVMILGAVALFMLISQRMNDIVDSNKFKPSNPAPNYNITVKKDTKAKRLTIENFEATFGTDSEDITKSDSAINFDAPITSDEGFRVVRKAPPEEFEQQKPEPETVTETQNEAILQEEPESFSEIQRDFNFEDDFSEMRIVGTKPSPKQEDKPVQPEIHIHEVEPAIQKQIQVPFAEAKVEEPAVETTMTMEPATKKEDAVHYKEKDVDIPLSLLMEEEPVFGEEPRKEFQYFISRVLVVIRSVISAKTSTFIMYNAEKGELVLESFATDVPEAITKKYKFPVGNDIISQIILNAKPEILTEINPHAELDLIPYYKQSAGTSSFVGIPIFYDSSVIGLICADTDVSDAYDTNTISFLGQFSKLIGSLLKSYIDKHDLLQASRTLAVINNLRSLISHPDFKIEELSESILDAASNLFEFSTIGISSFDDTVNNWTIRGIRSKDGTDNNLKGSTLNLDTTLTGKSITTSKTVWISPVDEKMLRFHQNETHIPKGFFVSVPLKTSANTFGAIFVDGKSPTSMTQYDLNILETLGMHAGAALEQFHLSRVLEFSAIVDMSTGLYNPPALYQRLEQELNRCNEFGDIFTFCLISIDTYASFDPEKFRERADKVNSHVLNIIKKNLRPFDIFGRVDHNTLGIILVGVPVNEAKIWAERLRSEIAMSVIEINGKRFTVTISMGIAESEKIKDVELLISNARKVHDISSSKSNCVSIYV